MESGYAQIGFADHTPWPRQESIQTHMRMPLDELDGYVSAVRQLGQEYSGKIGIHLGLEAEYYPEYMNWLRDTRERCGIDYLIFGNHYDTVREDFYFGAVNSPEDVRRYARHAIKGLESGLFACLAHPDVFMQGYTRFDANCRSASRDICVAAREHNVLLEYNLSGLNNHNRRGAGFPCPAFWEIAAEENAAAVIGIDAHSPERYRNRELYDLAVMHLSALGIKRADTITQQGMKPASIA